MEFRWGGVLLVAWAQTDTLRHLQGPGAALWTHNS
jgi:hypothetical protein